MPKDNGQQAAKAPFDPMRYLMLRLAEEATEVAHAALKVERFGPGPNPHRAVDNTFLLEKELGQLTFYVAELAKFKAIGTSAIRQHQRDHAELLAAKPELTAPYVVRVRESACEHQFASFAEPGACPSCGMQIVYCERCAENAPAHHGAPACRP